MYVPPEQGAYGRHEYLTRLNVTSLCLRDRQHSLSFVVTILCNQHTRPYLMLSAFFITPHYYFRIEKERGLSPGGRVKRHGVSEEKAQEAGLNESALVSNGKLIQYTIFV
jgi:hypothetical protein